MPKTAEKKPLRKPQQQKMRPGREQEMDPLPKIERPEYKGSGKLDNKVALITGGDSGIGRAVAVLFAREGASVAITYLPEEQPDADETRRAIEAAGAKCLAVTGNLTDPAFCDDIVEQTV